VGLLVPREECPYVGKRRKYTPEFREQVARLVIETGRPVAHVAAEIGVANKCWVVGCAFNAKPPWLVILARCLMLMNAQSWRVGAGKTLNYVWTVSF
jgi:Transposase